MRKKACYRQALYGIVREQIRPRNTGSPMASIKGQIAALGRTLVLLAAIALLIVLATDDVLAYLRQTRGVESGASSDIAPLHTPRLGINTSLERYERPEELAAALDEIQALGFRLLRQRISWAEIEPTRGQTLWDTWDSIASEVAARDLQLLVYVADVPEWARRAWERDNPWAPPADPSDYARFMGLVAQRYGHVVLAYQIWDQPNIHPHWGDGTVDPAGYVELLRKASPAIRNADPRALVVAGGLAPTVESGGRNLSDVRYLQEMHRLGAGPHYDVLGIRAFGFWSGPYDRRVDPDVLNFSRAILLREELLRRGLEARPVWAIDGGWCSLPSDWSGHASPSGSDAPLVQTQRLALAVERMRQEWPWLTWATLAHWQPHAQPGDPQWGYALLDPSGEQQAAYETVSEALRQDQDVLYPGITRSVQASRPTQNPDLADLTFWGTRLWILPASVTSPHIITARVDVQRTTQRITLPNASGIERIAVGGTVRLDSHTARLESQAPLTDVLEGFQVAAERPAWDLIKPLALGIPTLLALATVLWHELRALRWRQAWKRTRDVWRSVPASVRALVLIAALAGASLLESDGLVVLSAGIAVLAAALDPHHALLAAVLAIPLAPVTVRMSELRFSIAEVAVLLAAGAYVWEALVERELRVPRSPHTRWQVVADLGVIGLVVAGLLSASLAEYQRVAWREVRLCVLEPAILYYLLRASDEHLTAQMVAPSILLGGALTGLYALARYPSAAGVIEAEGVRRALGVFGSPNNLALMAERLVPLALAGALWSHVRARRVAYALAALILLATLALTFSKGALLLGLPFGIAALGYLRGGRWRLAWVLIAAGALLLAIPLLGSERLASMTDLTQGTAFLRIQLWRSAIAMIEDYPWFGVGPDGFLYYYGDYIRTGAEVEPWLSHPHNLLLSVWTRLGLSGLVAMVTLLAGTAGMVLNLDGRRCVTAIGLAAGFIAATAHGMVDSFFFVPELALWLMVAVASLSVCRAEEACIDRTA
jgi:hypothetical protein